MMDADMDVAPVAALLADPTRCRILLALSDGRALPACDLALEGGVGAPTVSFHLDKLLGAGLLSAEKHGRHRYYRLAGPEVARLLEALAVVARPGSPRTFREARAARAVREARTCYDHLAGRLGVAVTEGLVARHVLERQGLDFLLTRRGERTLNALGVDLDGARRSRRAFGRACLDWSERRHHLAGALGAALLDRLLALGWIERADRGRAVHLSTKGRRGLGERLGVALPRD
jgi:DNA-binding transcriptional ArsR family regulator